MGVTPRTAWSPSFADGDYTRCFHIGDAPKTDTAIFVILCDTIIMLVYRACVEKLTSCQLSLRHDVEIESHKVIK